MFPASFTNCAGGGGQFNWCIKWIMIFLILVSQQLDHFQHGLDPLINSSFYQQQNIHMIRNYEIRIIKPNGELPSSFCINVVTIAFSSEKVVRRNPNQRQQGFSTVKTRHIQVPKSFSIALLFWSILDRPRFSGVPPGCLSLTPSAAQYLCCRKWPNNRWGKVNQRSLLLKKQL